MIYCFYIAVCLFLFILQTAVFPQLPVLNSFYDQFRLSFIWRYIDPCARVWFLSFCLALSWTISPEVLLGFIWLHIVGCWSALNGQLNLFRSEIAFFYLWSSRWVCWLKIFYSSGLLPFRVRMQIFRWECGARLLYNCCGLRAAAPFFCYFINSAISELTTSWTECWPVKNDADGVAHWISI